MLQLLPFLRAALAVLAVPGGIRLAVAESSTSSCTAGRGPCLNLLQASFTSKEMAASIAQNLVAEEAAVDPDSPMGQVINTEPKPMDMFTAKSEGHAERDLWSMFSAEVDSANTLSDSMATEANTSNLASNVGAENGFRMEANSSSNVASDIAVVANSTMNLDAEANSTSNVTSDVAADANSSMSLDWQSKPGATEAAVKSNLTDTTLINGTSDASGGALTFELLITKPMTWGMYFYQSVTRMGDNTLLFILVAMVVAKIFSWV